MNVRIINVLDQYGNLANISCNFYISLAVLSRLEGSWT